MKEVTFIRQNLEKWRGYETVAESPALSTPDEMADAYIDVTSDLAFSQTHYPKSRITLYLNNTTAEERELLLTGCLMNHYAAQNK